jgi:Family of unknown function (DUF6288)
MKLKVRVMSKQFASVVVGIAGFMCSMAGTLCAAEQGKPEHYTTEEIKYQTRPNPASERHFGVIGTTGLKPRVYPGVVLKVEEMMPGSPSEGKFAKDEILTGINGTDLKGRDPFVAMGNALTKAEATDGKMIFDVTSADGKTQRKETVTIPVLGAYSKTWPLDCKKSKRIIDEAAAFYADPEKFNQGGIPGALGCLFLLSTGDDKYLPRVKAYFEAFPKDVKAIGDNTWNNGYNGIACGEYYLRTGDKSVLPILQYYCDDAKERQKFGCGWTHWGRGIHPGYVAGCLMNPAGAQVLTTLLLGKECGVNVDEETLLGSLRFFYRFAGHGTVPYGDHRGEGGLGSNGKDGMIAAAMQIASGSSGDTTIYEKASKYLALSMILSYESLVCGHADEGRGDGIWRGITTSYLMKEKPDLFRQSMDRLTWWHDLSREPGGSIGIATLDFDGGKVGSSGPGIGLSYTAPLQTLRITGAPRTKFSQKYTLPKNIWGTKADLAFLSIEHNPKYLTYGPEEPAHVPYYALGGAYHQPEKDIKTLPRETLLKNIYHRNDMIRTQAGKALRVVGAFDDLEKFLQDPDPRVRRAALDGLIDWNYWFGPGDNPISTEQFTPGMLAAITKMLSDPNESWYVKAGALMALKLAPAKDIQERYKLIQPWIKHTDWWLRDAAFTALSGLQKDDALYLEILPTLLTIATSEYHTMPRGWMMNHINSALQTKKPESSAGQLILAGLKKAATESEIKSGERSGEGSYNVMETVKVCLQSDPTLAVSLATALQLRFRDLGTGDIVGIVAAPGANPGGESFGFFTMLEKLDSKQRKELEDILFTVYRPEIAKRLKAKDYAEEAHKAGIVSTIIDLAKLRNPKAGWKPIGKVPSSELVWRFKSFDAIAEKDQLPIRERRRMRDIPLTDDLKDWFKPEFDDSKWNVGRAPIGTGLYKQGDDSFANKSDWGKGEFIVARTTFEVEKLDYDSYRLSILNPQGFKVYLNGHEIVGYGWWQDKPHYAPWGLGSGEAQHLKKGTNVIAVYSNVEYNQETKIPFGQVDCLIEGLKHSDIE